MSIIILSFDSIAVPFDPLSKANRTEAEYRSSLYGKTLPPPFEIKESLADALTYNLRRFRESKSRAVVRFPVFSRSTRLDRVESRYSSFLTGSSIGQKSLHLPRRIREPRKTDFFFQRSLEISMG